MLGHQQDLQLLQVLLQALVLQLDHQRDLLQLLAPVLALHHLPVQAVVPALLQVRVPLLDPVFHLLLHLVRDQVLLPVQAQALLLQLDQVLLQALLLQLDQVLLQALVRQLLLLLGQVLLLVVIVKWVFLRVVTYY